MRGGDATGVVVVNFGSHDLVSENLAEIGLDSGPTFVVIVDNFTTTSEAQSVARLCEERGWTAVLLATNTGFGAAVNRGVEAAQGLGCTSFLILNPDASIDRRSFELLRRRALDEPMLVQSPRVERPDGSLWFGGGTVSIDRGTARTIAGSDSSAPFGWLSGACILVTEDVWEASGGFDERYFLYWEDIDFSFRCVATGARLEVTAEALAIHSVGGTQPGTGKSPAYVYYNCRNRLLFAASHLEVGEVRRWLKLSIRYARQILLRGGRRALLRRPVSLLSAAVGGTAAGVVLALPAALARVRRGARTDR